MYANDQKSYDYSTLVTNIRTGLNGLKSYQLDYGLSKVFKYFAMAKKQIFDNTSMSFRDKDNCIHALSSLIGDPIRYYCLNKEANYTESDIVRLADDGYKGAGRSVVPSEDLELFLMFFRKYKAERRIKDNVEIVSKRVTLKRLMDKYAEEDSEYHYLIRDVYKPIVIITMLRYFSTYKLSEAELIAFTTEMFAYEYKTVMKCGDMDVNKAFRTCVYYTALSNADEELNVSHKKMIEDAAYILDQSNYLNTRYFYADTIPNVDTVQFKKDIYVDPFIKEYLLLGLHRIQHHENDMDIDISEYCSHADSTIAFLYAILPILCIYSPLVESDDGERNNWNQVEKVIRKYLIRGGDNSKYFVILMENLISAYSNDIETLSDKEEMKKEKMVMMLKDALKQFMTETEIHEELKKEIAPVIDPNKDRRELGFNEQEEEVLKAIFTLGEAIAYATDVDFDKIKNVFMFENESAAQNELMVDYVTDFSIKNPKIIDPSYLAQRMKNINEADSIKIGTALKDSIYKLGKASDRIHGDVIKFVSFDHIVNMIPDVQKISEDVCELGEQLHILDAIASLDAADEASVTSIVSTMKEKAKNAKEGKSSFTALSSVASKVAEVVKDASDITDPTDKNTFLKTKVLPLIKGAIKTAALTGIGALINPAVALAGLCIGLYTSKNAPKEAKQQLVNELETNLSMIDRSIQKAKDEGDEDKERNLRLLKKKMQVQYAKIAAESRFKGDVVLGKTGKEDEKKSSWDDD